MMLWNYEVSNEGESVGLKLQYLQWKRGYIWCVEGQRLCTDMMIALGINNMVASLLNETKILDWFLGVWLQYYWMKQNYCTESAGFARLSNTRRNGEYVEAILSRHSLKTRDQVKQRDERMTPHWCTWTLVTMVVPFPSWTLEGLAPSVVP